jgi:hypothetical protein
MTAGTDTYRNVLVGQVHWNENDLASSVAGHRLQSLELPDLDGLFFFSQSYQKYSYASKQMAQTCRRRAENIGDFSHELSCVNLGFGRDNFGFSNTLGLRSRRKRSLKL